MQFYSTKQLKEMLQEIYLSNDFDEQILKETILNELLKREK